MKTTRFLLGAAVPMAVAAWLSGCATTTPPPPSTPPIATTIETNPGQLVSPATPTPTTGRMAQDSMAPEATVAEVKHFNLKITANGSELAEPVRQSVEGQLANAGYTLIHPESGDGNNAPSRAADILVDLTVSSSVFDRSGGGGSGDNGVNYTGYVRYEGSLTADITRAWDGKKLGFAPISVRGKRGLGDAEAQRNLTAQLVEQAGPIILNAVRPELTGLAVNDVIIKRPWLASHELRPNSNPALPWITSNDPEYVQNFIANTKSMNGVVYCALVAEDYQHSTMTFRVVYLADAMPGNLINHLALNQQFQTYHFKQ